MAFFRVSRWQCLSGKQYNIFMTEFVDYLHEVFEQSGSIRTRKMFGGHGVYHNDLMFGLVADDELYLKTDQQSAMTFQERGLCAFEYQKNGKAFKMSYCQAPEEIYDDPEEARVWATLAFDAALRSASKNKR